MSTPLLPAAADRADCAGTASSSHGLCMTIAIITATTRQRGANG